MTRPHTRRCVVELFTYYEMTQGDSSSGRLNRIQIRTFDMTPAEIDAAIESFDCRDAVATSPHDQSKLLVVLEHHGEGVECFNNWVRELLRKRTLEPVFVS